MNKKHAFVVAGTHSGCGKTTISLGLMAAFRDRGFRTQPFKVGPDFIDPGFHTQATGQESRNLDGWMLSPDYNQMLFYTLLRKSDIAVVEGVMGLFDGYDGASESGSTAEMAKWLELPVVLVVDARSMARSAAALVHGFRHFDPQLNLAGVIFNRVGGEGHFEYLKEAMSAALPEIPVLGGIPRDNFISIPERHLGLVTADEVHLSPEWSEGLVRLVQQHIDLDLLLRKTEYKLEAAQEITKAINVSKPGKDLSTSISVARDAAFCFYYPDNFQLLRQAGADLHFFSPLAGESFPQRTAGLYLGGGYPELFAENLSEQKAFFRSILKGVDSGLPIYGECGGLMVLSRYIESIEGKRYRMAGVLPFGTRMLPRRKALGYTEVVLRRPCLLGEPGLKLRGHEFHYSEIKEDEERSANEEGQGFEPRPTMRIGIPPIDFSAERRNGVEPNLVFAYKIKGRKQTHNRHEGYRVGSVLASYIHLHWGSAPEAPEFFVKRCLEYQKSNGR